MTSTISPRASDDVGARTINMVPFTDGLPPRMRRPDASGEFPIVPVVPGVQTRLVGADELQRLSAGETLVLPVDAVPIPACLAVPTVYEQPAPEDYRGRHRSAWTLPLWLRAVVCAVAFLAGLTLGVVLAVTW